MNKKMDDLISRQAAIELCDWYQHEFCECDYAFGELSNELYKLPAAPQWIPVSERLPENSGRYLVTRGHNACGALWNRVYIVNYSDLMGLKTEKIFWQGNVGKSDFEVLFDVIAWMPFFPEPYKEVE